LIIIITVLVIVTLLTTLSCESDFNLLLPLRPAYTRRISPTPEVVETVKMCRWFAYISPDEDCLLEDVLITPVRP
jgi:hypothetical protein